MKAMKLKFYQALKLLCRPFIELDGWCHMRIWLIKYGNCAPDVQRLIGWSDACCAHKQPGNTRHKE